jgi:UMP-CMP kinase
MAATACGRQGWRQLIRNSCHGPATTTPSKNLLRQQQPYRLAFQRQASSTTRTTPHSLLRQQPLAQRSYSSGSQGGQQTPPPPRSSNSQIKFWPFVVLIALGSGGYMLLINRRKSELSCIPAGWSGGRGGV